MGIALAAEHFGAVHAEAAVGFLGDVLFGDGGPEARPARAGLELGVGAEQGIGAADAAVKPFIVQLAVRAAPVLFVPAGRLWKETRVKAAG
jgi:hypothetical protein